MKVAVWIVSGLLAVAFLLVGGLKVLAPAAELAAVSGGVPVVLLKIAGTAEVLGALGLVLPAATRILPILTPLAGAGLVIVMIGATAINLALGVYSAVGMTVVLGLLAGFVAWARYGPAAIAPRSAEGRPAAA